MTEAATVGIDRRIDPVDFAASGPFSEDFLIRPGRGNPLAGGEGWWSITIPAGSGATSAGLEFVFTQTGPPTCLDVSPLFDACILLLPRHPRLLVSGLGWSREEAAEARARLLAFEDDWNAPGMEQYDRL